MGITLLIRKILMILASILAMFIIIILVIHYFMDTLAWDIFFVSLVFITILFLIAHIVPKLSIVSFMIDIHVANQNQDEQLEDHEPYLFDTSMVLSYPKRLISGLKKSLDRL
jgi:hypothetical protein